MTRQRNINVMEEVRELICENGLEGLDQAISILINEAMKIERGVRSERALKLAVAEMYPTGCVL